MGKRLQKFLHGIVPSWLSKVKASSRDTPPRKMLPFFRDGDGTSSNMPPSSSALTSTLTRTTEAMALGDEYSDKDKNSFLVAGPPPINQKESEVQREYRRDTRMEAHQPPADSSQLHHLILQQLLPKDDSLQSECGYHDFNIAAVPHMPFTSQNHLVGQEFDHMTEHIYHRNDESQQTQGNSGRHKNTHEEMMSMNGGRADKNEGLGRVARSGKIEKWPWSRGKGEKSLMSCELPESICSIVGSGKAVVEQRLDPHLAIWESMVEMILGNGLHDLGSLEFLLNCYLSLNEPHLHPIIYSSFLQVLEDLQRIQ